MATETIELESDPNNSYFQVFVKFLCMFNERSLKDFIHFEVSQSGCGENCLKQTEF